jgi:TPR repeat protein
MFKHKMFSILFSIFGSSSNVIPIFWIFMWIALLAFGIKFTNHLIDSNKSQHTIELDHAKGKAGEWRTLAKEGNAIAQYNLGIIYSNGALLNDDKAVKWLTLAADQGHADAQNELGFIYDNGLGVLYNYKTALKWYTLAAEQGLADAQNNAGMIYQHGRGAPKNDRTAVKWYSVAAEQGHAEAQYNLGVMTQHGKGAPKNDKTAFTWYTLAAKQGYAKAQLKLGSLYGGGDIPINAALGYMWSNLASYSAHKDADGVRDYIAQHMTETEISDAQDMATRCLASNYADC